MCSCFLAFAGPKAMAVMMSAAVKGRGRPLLPRRALPSPLLKGRTVKVTARQVRLSHVDMGRPVSWLTHVIALVSGSFVRVRNIFHAHPEFLKAPANLSSMNFPVRCWKPIVAPNVPSAQTVPWMFAASTSNFGRTSQVSTGATLALVQITAAV